jgi:tetratricopeptide (TPR) repeat protein
MISFEANYQAGKEAIDRGEYRAAVTYLESAIEQISANTLQGGEVQMMLVMALEASGRLGDAIALCQKLLRHPHPDIRQSSKRVLYIMQAPQLKRPQEWMSEIPDLTNLDDDFGKSPSSGASGSTSTARSSSPVDKFVNSEDLSQIETRDNGFIWVAAIAIGGVLVWMAISI